MKSRKRIFACVLVVSILYSSIGIYTPNVKAFGVDMSGGELEVERPLFTKILNNFGSYYQEEYIPQNKPVDPVNGEKYADSDGTEFVYDSETEKYYSKTPISWLVLQESDEDMILLSEKVLEISSYKENMSEWLNNTFYDTAFNEKEKKEILSTVHADNGKEVDEKVYLLSAAEATNPDYGFTPFDNSLSYAKAHNHDCCFLHACCDQHRTKSSSGHENHVGDEYTTWHYNETTRTADASDYVKHKYSPSSDWVRPWKKECWPWWLRDKVEKGDAESSAHVVVCGSSHVNLLDGGPDCSARLGVIVSHSMEGWLDSEYDSDSIIGIRPAIRIKNIFNKTTTEATDDNTTPDSPEEPWIANIPYLSKMEGNATDEVDGFFPSEFSYDYCELPVTYEIEVDKKSGNRTIKLIIKSEADNGDDGGGKETDTLKIGGFGTITGKVAGYGKIVLDKKGNVIESGFGLSSEVNWEAHKSWCIATPIGPVYFTVGAEAKGDGEMTTKYDIEKEKWDDLSGKYTIGGGLFLEGGYGEPDIASVGV